MCREGVDRTLDSRRHSQLTWFSLEFLTMAVGVHLDVLGQRFRPVETYNVANQEGILAEAMPPLEGTPQDPGRAYPSSSGIRWAMPDGTIYGVTWYQLQDLHRQVFGTDLTQ